MVRKNNIYNNSYIYIYYVQFLNINIRNIYYIFIIYLYIMNIKIKLTDLSLYIYNNEEFNTTLYNEKNIKYKIIYRIFNTKLHL